MSCGLTCRVYSGNKMFRSVLQCVRREFVRNRKTIWCGEIRSTTTSLKTLIVVKNSNCLFKGLPSGPKEFRRPIPFLENHPIVCYNGNLYSTCQANDLSANNDTPESKLTLYQKFKLMYKQYWYVLLPVHIVTSSIWFGSFYYLAASGIDIPALLESMGAPDSWVESLKSSKTGNLVLAYTLYKVATPLRYTVTLGGTTLSINYLKNWGLIKPVPNREQIKKMYEQQKGAFKEFRTSYQDKMQVTKDEFLKTKKEMKQHYLDKKKGIEKSVKETSSEFAEGVKSATYEWKLIGGWFVKNLKEFRIPFGSKK